MLTDRLHKSQFALQCNVLRHLFMLVETGKLTVPLWDKSLHPGMNNNSQFVRTSMAHLLSNHFKNLSRAQVAQSTEGFFYMQGDEAQYRTKIRDFLIQIKEFSQGDDNDQLYAEEKQTELSAKQSADRTRRAAVPGMLNPHEIEDDDDL